MYSDPETQAHGFNDRLADVQFSANPYSRNTEDWHAWRNGWVAADEHLRQSILIFDKKKASDE